MSHVRQSALAPPPGLQSSFRGSPNRPQFSAMDQQQMPNYEERKDEGFDLGGSKVDINAEMFQKLDIEGRNDETGQHPSPPLEEEIEEKQIPFDEQVIPTIQKKNPNESKVVEEGGEGAQEEEAKVEEISPENMKYAEPLIPILGEEVVKKMFSRPWTIREEGLKEAEEIIKGQANDQAVFMAAISLSSQAMGDKILQIIQRGLSILHTTLKSSTSQLESGSAQNSCFNQIFLRLGDNNPRIKAKAEEILFMMAGHPSFGAQIVCQHITKGHGKKSTSSLRHIVGKMQLLHKILEKYPIKEHGINHTPVIEFGMFGLKHSHQDVRASAF